MRKTILVSAVLILLGIGSAWTAPCTPTSVQVCGVADDYMTIWVNGVQIGAGNDYRILPLGCPAGPAWSVCPTPVCVTTTDPTILNNIGSTGILTVAAQVANAQGHDLYGSWLADVTCSSGQHAFLESAGNSTEAFVTSGTGTAPACSPVTLPAVTSGNWYDSAPALFPGAWNPAVEVSAGALTLDSSQIPTRSPLDPSNGLQIPLFSYNAQAGEGGLGEQSCALLYLSQSVTINPVNPQPPPNFTITKSAATTSGIVAGEAITYTVSVSNSGGFTGQPVTVVDNLDSHWSYAGPYSSGLPNMDLLPGSSAVDFVFPLGFAAGGIVVSNFQVAEYFMPVSEYCTTRNNTAVVTYNNGVSLVSTVSNTIAVTMACPAPTNTPTITSTPCGFCTSTPTPSFTNTLSPTMTFSPTYTACGFCTATPTPSFTKTYSPTMTYSPTAIGTLTTPTFTPSFTNTPLALPSLTYTPSGFCTATPTPTLTTVNTPTNTYSPTFTWSPTSTSTPSAPTATFTPSPTGTNTPTPTWTPSCCTAVPTTSPTGTATYTPTVTPTFTKTPTSTYTPTSTWTLTWTNTLTPTPSWTPTPSATASPSPTASGTPTSTATLGGSPSPSPVPTPRNRCYLFPSPARGDHATVCYQMAQSGKCRLRVWNAAGDLISDITEVKGSGLQSTQLTIRTYAAGVYLYRCLLRYDDGTEDPIETKKFIVVR